MIQPTTDPSKRGELRSGVCFLERSGKCVARMRREVCEAERTNAEALCDAVRCVQTQHETALQRVSDAHAQETALRIAAVVKAKDTILAAAIL